MEFLSTTSFGRSISFNCHAISRVEEHLSDSEKCLIFNLNDTIGTIVDMPYLEVVGYLKGVQ